MIEKITNLNIVLRTNIKKRYNKLINNNLKIYNYGIFR